jgi:MOSC domain-containing protein YiiM
MSTTPYVHSTHLSKTHSFSKTYQPSITLVAGQGVQGDCHAGLQTQHLSQASKDPEKPNLRQIHLLPYELFYDLAAQGVAVQPGELGENITTYGVDLTALSRGTLLYFGGGQDDDDDEDEDEDEEDEEGAVVVVTGLRNPGRRLDEVKPGLREKLVVRQKGKKTVRKAGVMGIVLRGGAVKQGDMIRVVKPPGEKVPLEPV